MHRPTMMLIFGGGGYFGGYRGQCFMVDIVKLITSYWARCHAFDCKGTAVIPRLSSKASFPGIFNTVKPRFLTRPQ